MAILKSALLMIAIVVEKIKAVCTALNEQPNLFAVQRTTTKNKLLF
jgi:hypothetical protein